MKIKPKPKKLPNKRPRYARARAKKSYSSSLRKLGQTSINNVKIIIITVIVLAMATVILSAWCLNFMRPENSVYRNIEMIAKDFYVNDFYKQSVEASSKTPAELFARYSENGLASIPLRRLLVYAQNKYPQSVQEIRKYCNENTSSVKFFPTDPYGKDDFTAKYVNDCRIK